LRAAGLIGRTPSEQDLFLSRGEAD